MLKNKIQLAAPRLIFSTLGPPKLKINNSRSRGEVMKINYSGYRINCCDLDLNFLRIWLECGLTFCLV